MPSDGVKFPKTEKRGQKSWDYPWDTYADEIIVQFDSDSDLGGTGFDLSFSEAERQYGCQKRADCGHIGLNQHICDFDKHTLDQS